MYTFPRPRRKLAVNDVKSDILHEYMILKYIRVIVMILTHIHKECQFSHH